MSDKMSVQTELHRHLDVSLRPSTVLELARKKGLVPETMTLAQLQDRLIMKSPLADLTAVLAEFALFQEIQDRPDTLERIAFEVAEDCYAEGTRRLELRFSPSFVCEKSGLPWSTALDAYSRGLARARAAYPDLEVGLICIATRDFGVAAVDRTAEFFLENQARFIGFDLAGNEVNFPCRMFVDPMRKLQAAKAKITVHAGEACGPENIWEAIELLGAHRIGHGIRSIDDPKLIAHLAKNRICLEICPTSNWLTRAVPSLGEHPLPKLLRAGVPVCINTDDPGVFGVTLPDEIATARNQMGLTEGEILRCQGYAFEASFLTR